MKKCHVVRIKYVQRFDIQRNVEGTPLYLYKENTWSINSTL